MQLGVAGSVDQLVERVDARQSKESTGSSSSMSSSWIRFRSSHARSEMSICERLCVHGAS
eukprot:871104-Prymnesium_polylepis.1